MIRRRLERALPRGGLRGLSLVISAEREEGGEEVLTIEAEVDAHPGVKCDVEALVEEAIAEAFEEADKELSKAGLRASDKGEAVGRRSR